MADKFEYLSGPDKRCDVFEMKQVLDEYALINGNNTLRFQLPLVSAKITKQRRKVLCAGLAKARSYACDHHSVHGQFQWKRV